MIAAVVAGVTSLVVAFLTAYVTARQGRLTRAIQAQLTLQQQEAQNSLEEKRIAAQRSISDAQTAAQKELEAYKNQLQLAGQHAERVRTLTEERDSFWLPLRDAADDLRHRIRNIRELQFRSYFAEDQARRDVALRSTFYRFARYWGAVENVDRADARLRLKEERPRVWETMTLIGRTFAVDDYGLPFMVWREEQRAIGELVLEAATGDGPRPLLGFASFARRYEEDFATWFMPLDRDLHEPGVEQNKRLADLQYHLGQLVERLDEPTQRTTGDPATASPVGVGTASA